MTRHSARGIAVADVASASGAAQQAAGCGRTVYRSCCIAVVDAFNTRGSSNAANQSPYACAAVPVNSPCGVTAIDAAVTRANDSAHQAARARIA